MHKAHVAVFAGLLASLFALPVHADFIVYATDTDHALAPGASLDEVRMSVALIVADDRATMSFTNTSLSPAVLTEIVVDACDDDTGAALLWDGTILTDTPEVAFRLGRSRGLPGHREPGAQSSPLVKLRAQGPPLRNGLDVGETLEVQFTTSLADGSDMCDYLAFFDTGLDTGQHSIGFRALAAAAGGGEQVFGTYVPEPASMALLILGAPLAVKSRWARGD